MTVTGWIWKLVTGQLSEVSPKIINFQLELHLLITWVISLHQIISNTLQITSDYFRFIESLRTCIIASQPTGNLKIKVTYRHFGFEEF